MSVGSLVDFEKLDEETQHLIREGAKARLHSYSPYSKFKVGSALRCGDGSLRTGCNVENASFGASICAERVALTKAISEGLRSFHSISVIAEKIEGRFTTPCGVCRQTLSEFGDYPVYISSPDMRQILVTSTHQLLPHAFIVGSRDDFMSSNSTQLDF